jgi:hypothetical protein
MIAHVGGVPVEELLPLALASGSGIVAYLVTVTRSLRRRGRD